MGHGPHLDEDPRYAPAWARLGRMHRVFAKFEDRDHQPGFARAEQAFKRALEINPDLSLAHNLYAYLKIDCNRAEEAMVGLIERAKSTPSDAELFAGLVQACRVCGLLNASVAAHERVRALDEHLPTSVGYAYFWLNDFDRLSALTLSPFDQYLLAFADVRRQHEARALDRIRAIIDAHENAAGPGAARIRDIAIMYRSAILHRGRDCLEMVDRIVDRFCDAEGFYFMASACVEAGEPEAGLALWRRAVENGFFNYPAVVGDPWLQKLRGRPEFDDLVDRTRSRHLAARAMFLETGGSLLLALRGDP